MSAGESEQSFYKLDQFGAIEEVEDDHDRMEKIAQLRIDAIKEGKSSLIVSPVHADARAIAQVVREAMRTVGLITGPDLEVTRLQRLNLTEAQRGDAITYEPGQVVEFHRLARGVPRQKRFKSGEQWTVVDRPGAEVMLDRNEERKTLPLGQAGKFEVYRPQELCVAAGENIRITKNFVAGGKKYFNNEVHTVSEIRGGKIILSDGCKLDLNLLHIDQGHVVTSHAAQGKTVEIVTASMAGQFFQSGK